MILRFCLQCNIWPRSLHHGSAESDTTPQERYLAIVLWRILQQPMRQLEEPERDAGKARAAHRSSERIIAHRNRRRLQDPGVCKPCFGRQAPEVLQVQGARQALAPQRAVCACSLARQHAMQGSSG